MAEEQAQAVEHSRIQVCVFNFLQQLITRFLLSMDGQILKVL
jgi:hypothetical protein